MDLEKWATLINATGKATEIENCHWGGDLPFYNDDGSLWCPFNFFRTSRDVDASFSSVMFNLWSTTPFQDLSQPLSQPGCFSYPDMLEVGNLPTSAEDRTHFGAWAIVSSPLILGMDLTSSDVVDRVWDIITNTEVLEVNQAWAGHPGRSSVCINAV